jgi:hypothetical protein
MHWRVRMTAIVIAGGSIAACAGRTEKQGESGPDRAQGGPAALGSSHDAAPTPTSPGERLRAPLPEGRVSGGWAVPACNANPDPCCRFPDGPTCHVDAGDAEAVRPRDPPE